MSFSELSSNLGVSINTIRDRVFAMERRGVIRGFRAVIDRATCGLPSEALIFLKAEPGAKPSIESAIQRAGPLRISAAFRVVGSHNYVVHAHGSDQFDALAPFRDLQTPLHFVPLRSKIPLGRQENFQTWKRPPEEMLRLLELVSQDGRASIRAIAEGMDAPETTVRDQLRNLEQRKIIHHYAAIVDPCAFGFTLRAYIIGNANDHRKEEIASENIPEGLCNIYMGDQGSIVLDVAASSVAELEALTDFVVTHLNLELEEVLLLASPIVENATAAMLLASRRSVTLHSTDYQDAQLIGQRAGDSALLGLLHKQNESVP